MSNRVLLGALGGGDYGLRVSRPGYDVTDPDLTKEQLAFDSRWEEVSNVYMYGTLSWAPTSQTAWGGTGMVINFGVGDFDYAPVVFGLLNIGTTGYHFGGNMDYWIGGTGSGRGLLIKSSTTGAFFAKSGSGAGGPLHYVVLRNTYQNV